MPMRFTAGPSTALGQVAAAAVATSAAASSAADHFQSMFHMPCAQAMQPLVLCLPDTRIAQSVTAYRHTLVSQC